MNIPDPSTLRKAIALTTEIERLEHTLHELLKNALSKSEASVSSDTKPSLSKVSKEVLRSGPPKGATKVSKGSSVNVAKAVAMKAVPVSVNSETIHHDPLLLVDDSGGEQLALVSEQESCTLHQHSHAEESCSLPHASANDQAGEGTASSMESSQ